MSTIRLKMGEFGFKFQPIRADRENGIAPDERDRDFGRF
jgi:hypothetical protein